MLSTETDARMDSDIKLPAFDQGLSYICYSTLCCSHQPTNNESEGTLAEWLTRGPAKLISSEACVRITQVSTQLFLFAKSNDAQQPISTGRSLNLLAENLFLGVDGSQNPVMLQNENRRILPCVELTTMHASMGRSECE
jgi:hypothetical protein